MLPPKKQAPIPAGAQKKTFSKDQTSYDTERDLLGKPQKFGAAMPDDDPGAGNMGKPGGAHAQTEPEGQELPNNTGTEVPSKPEEDQSALPAKPGMEKGEGAEGEYAPTPPTLPAMASKMDEVCQTLDQIKAHLGLDKDDEKPGATPTAPMGNDDEGGGFGGFGG